MSDKIQWPRVSKSNPCPICGKPDFCTITPDGKAVCCMRVESNKPVKNGGYMHFLDDQTRIRVPKKRAKCKQITNIDFSAMAIEAANATGGYVAELAEQLEIPILSFIHLCVGYRLGLWTFPMKDAKGYIIGIRTRNAKGEKRAIKGSKSGLFIPATSIDPYEPLYICEGPTDTAALMGLGFQVIGRPSCMGGTDMVFEFCERHKIKDVVIFADRDEPKKRPDGSVWYPGVDGANRLVEAIKPVLRSVKVIKPPHFKDVRKWINNGATKDSIISLVANTNYY